MSLDIEATSGNAKALVITMLFRLLFGGYIIGMDQFRYNDPESAITVFFTYLLMGGLLSLFLTGKRIGLKGLIGFEAFFIALNSLFVVLSLMGIVDAGLHSPMNNVPTMLIRYIFSITTLTFATRAYKETQRR
jgi:hypothetical protein